MLGLINTLTSAAVSTGWKAVRSFNDGLTGTTRYNGMAKGWHNAAGESVAFNPAQKLARRLRADAQQMVTGNKYNAATMEKQLTDQKWFGRNVGNRIGGAAHLIGDATLGTIGTGLGWATRMTGMVGYAVAKPTARVAGHVAYQGLDAAVSTATFGARSVAGLSANPIGREALFAGGLAIAAGYGLKDAFQHDLLPGGGNVSKGMEMYYGNSIDSVPGTLASQGVGQQSNVMVDTGADGDLVLALHKLR